MTAVAHTAESQRAMSLDAIRELFGIERLRRGQKTLIMASVEGKDTLGILPTGYGKSLCYIAPGLMTGEITLVVSPLIALMEDQVQSLRRRGIRAYAVHSGMEEIARSSAFINLRLLPPGNAAFLFVSPETLLSKWFHRHFGRINFTRVAIDEAHCVSTWGNAFRPDYLRIRRGLKPLGIKIVSAFTATLDPKIERDIQRWLPLGKDLVRVEIDPIRPNLQIVVKRQPDGYAVRTPRGREKVRALCNVLQTPGYVGPAIVYCTSRDGSATLYSTFLGSDFVKKTGYYPLLFHAELPQGDKDMALDVFRTHKRPLVFATSAFGLGIDRPDVRQIVHYTVPYSVVDYAQQIGRGGRDGALALCTAFHPPETYLSRSTGRVSVEVPSIENIERTLGWLRQTLRRLPKGRRESYTLKQFRNSLARAIEGNEQLSQKSVYLLRLNHAISILQSVGLITEHESTGLQALPVIPGTPPHEKLIEAAKMHERMQIREVERLSRFFGAEKPDQHLLWDIIRSK